jgi:hypothetical protein
VNRNLRDERGDPVSKTARERLDELVARFPHTIHPEGNLRAAILGHLEAAIREAEEGEWRRCMELLIHRANEETRGLHIIEAQRHMAAVLWLQKFPPHPVPAVTEGKPECKKPRCKGYCPECDSPNPPEADMAEADNNPPIYPDMPRGNCPKCGGNGREQIVTDEQPCHIITSQVSCDRCLGTGRVPDKIDTRQYTGVVVVNWAG